MVYTLVLQGACILLWIAFIVLLMRSGNTAEQKRAGTIIFPLPILILAFFIVSFIVPFAWAFFPVSVVGMLAFLFGFLWTQWAKAVLGANWSSGNALMMSHEISREMPYSLMRHPFYFGLLIMFFGTALVFGNLTMIAATVVCSLLLAFNAMMEENMLKDEFGHDYIEYQEEVPFVALLPGPILQILSRKQDDEL